ncbi:hypothetical protein TBR22_A06520 [Luteitalea sp. TBR-22]|uniref:sulfotransferase family protein n=1 Tax=Luteitalea sp. TBR-22 TaxID=2802971 RepID=UPI001AF2C190|nr:sulfotransferase family protein [Luteitalea sp. TBR-22]BCS31451.1 hypothetical protein TBR22_A06520 [Luteitalea sp. TBR-22]
MNRKVFGLGLSKTGTSSLAEALTLLGIRTIHYPSDATTLRELRAGCTSLTVMASYDAAVDIPVAPYYAQLDAAYPGSKFILTVREEGAWLRSVELHWQLMMDWWQRAEDFRRFQEFISGVVYGAVEFDRDRFARAYAQHRAGVLAYFAGRPDDLLVMDVAAGDGWDALCPFLGVPTPNPPVPFPHANEWMHRWLAAQRTILGCIPEGARFVLADLDAFGRDFAPDRTPVPFTQRDGTYWGPPADDAHACEELARARAEGLEYFVLGWPAFWFTGTYPALMDALERQCACVARTGDVVVWRIV